MHKYKVLAGAISCILFVSCFVVLYNVELYSTGVNGASGQDIWVDDDQRYPDEATGTINNPYRSISDAIEAANNGDTINVLKGSYSTGFSIDKSIHLISEDVSNTFITGSSLEPYMIDITASSVSIGGFTIKDLTSTSHRKAIIRIPSDVDDVSIINNKITQSERGYGIFLDGAQGAVIKNNVISYTLGIDLNGASGNSIYGNKIDNCSGSQGIRLISSNSNNIENNEILFNNHGIYSTGSSENYIQGNIICNNAINGVYIKNGNENVIKNNTIKGNSNSGIDITSSGSQILENWIYMNNMGIMLGASNCVIFSNRINDQLSYGIYTMSSASENIIYNNTFVDSSGSYGHFAKENGNNIWDNENLGNYWDDFYGPDPQNPSNLDTLVDSDFFYTLGGVRDEHPKGRYQDAPGISGPNPAHLGEGVSLHPVLSVKVVDPDPSPYKSRLDVDFYYIQNNVSHLVGSTNVNSGATASVAFSTKYSYIGVGYDYICVWYVIVKDKYTQTRSSDYIFSTLEVPFDNEKPTVDAGGPYSGQIGEAIQFDGSGSSDSDGEIVFYRWGFGDGSSVTNVVSPTHTYEDSGKYTASLVVIDDKGGISTVDVTVDIKGQENDPPVANAGGPYEVNIGKVVDFSSSGTTDPDLDINENEELTYYWNFGDGVGNSTDPHPSYSYSKAKNYTVTLTVTDHYDESDTDTTHVLVMTIKDDPSGFLGLPGFEITFSLVAILFVLALKRKRKS